VDLAIIIVSFNVRELLARCLASVYSELKRSPEFDVQVWVVDNASADGSTAMVREEFPQAHLLASDYNLGFAAGNNLALRALGTGNSLPRYILLLNPDTELRDGALATLVRFMDEHPAVGACGAQLLYSDGSFQHSAFRFPDLAQVFFDFFPLHHRLTDSWLNGRYPRRLYQAGRPFAVDHPLGAALMVRRETIEQVGLLDERFFMYCEEIDWCLRIRQAGWEIFCVPQARIIHHVAQSTRQCREAMFVTLWQSRFRLFQKHYPPAFLWAARWLVRVGLANEANRARAAYSRGEINAQELAGRLAAYEEVRQMG